MVFGCESHRRLIKRNSLQKLSNSSGSHATVTTDKHYNMSWFGSAASIDSEVEKATNESIPFGETDLAASLEVADLIRSKKVPPKEAMRSLKKRLNGTRNPNTQMATLHLIDTCVKNGGAHFIQEIATREFMDTLVSLIHEDRTSESVRDLALDLVQSWASAFKDNPQLKYVGNAYRHLQDDRYTFPNVSGPVSSTLFDSSAPPEWEDSDACMICSDRFTMINRKHHCRNCGGVYCQSHSGKTIALPHLGITEPVRVCDSCYDDIHHHTKKSSKKGRRSKHDKDVSRARAQYDSDDDEDLKKALELSLRESQGYAAPVAPEPVKSVAPIVDEEEDQDMKAAIAASLREFEQEKQRSQPQQQPQPQVDSPYSNLLPQQSTAYQSTYAPEQQQQQQHLQQQHQYAPQQTFPPNYITSQDETHIIQFANMVQDLQNNPGAAYENSELTQSYREAMPLAPKLAIDLNESLAKHDELLVMNQKIDTIMKMYNNLLDSKIERETQQRQQFSLPSYPPQQQEQQTYYPLQHSPQQLSAQPTYQSPLQQQHQLPPQQQAYQPTSQVPQTYHPQFTSLPPQSESPYPTNSYPEPPHHEEEIAPESELPSYPPQQQEEEFSAPPPVMSMSPVQQVVYPPQQESPVQQQYVPQSPVEQQQQQQRAKITDFSFPSVPVSKPPVLTQQQVEVAPPKEEQLIEL